MGGQASLFHVHMLLATIRFGAWEHGGPLPGQ